MARFSSTSRRKVDIVGPAAFVGAHRTRRRHAPRARTAGSVVDPERPKARKHDGRRDHAEPLEGAHWNPPFDRSAISPLAVFVLARAQELRCPTYAAIARGCRASR